VSEEAKEIERLLKEHQRGRGKCTSTCEVHQLGALARRLLSERDEALREQKHAANLNLAACERNFDNEKRLASLERANRRLFEKHEEQHPGQSCTQAACGWYIETRDSEKREEAK